MAITLMILDPDAVAYTDDEIVAKINSAAAPITRADSVSPEARPLTAGEAASNLDNMDELVRGYVKTNPATGEFPVISVQRDAAGKLCISYDDVSVV